MSFEELYLAHQSLVEQAIAAVCRRSRFSATDAEDFAGVVRLHLVKDDYAVLRKCKDASLMRGYLIAVVAHQAQDWRNARWGKWRPSAEARRLGAVAVHLERLIVRDGMTFEEAVERLRTDVQITESRPALEQIAARFPVRHKRRF